MHNSKKNKSSVNHDENRVSRLALYINESLPRRSSPDQNSVPSKSVPRT